MGGVMFVLLIGAAWIAFVCYWINKGPPEPPEDDDAGKPSDYGADGP